MAATVKHQPESALRESGDTGRTSRLAKAELTSAVGTLGLVVGGAVIFVPILLILVAAVGSLGNSPATPAEVQRISDLTLISVAGLATL